LFSFIFCISFELQHLSSPCIADKFMYVKKSDSLLIFATGRGLSFYNINDFPPKLITRYATDGIAQAFDIKGNYIYIADRYKGLRIIDISNPSSIHDIGNFIIGDQVYDVFLSQNYGYIANGKDGLVIIEISDPVHIKTVGRCVDIGQSITVTVKNGFAYVGSFNGPMKIIDISNPFSPFKIGQFPLDSLSYGINAFIEDSIGFFNCGYFKNNRIINFAIVNIKNPMNPIILSELTLSPTNMGIDKYKNNI